MWKRIILWIVTLLWACGIFCFSAQPAKQSAEVSSEITKKIVRCLSSDDISESELATRAVNLHRAVRKVAHFSLYLVLGVLLFLLCTSHGVRSKYVWLLALGLSTLYAVSDEIHQLFVPGRSGQVTDVLLDSFGAFVGILLILVWIQVWKAVIKKR